MIGRRLVWQLPVAILLSAPLWHGPVADFLAIRHQALEQKPAHQDSNFTMEGVLFRQARQGVEELMLKAKRLRGAGQGKGFDLEGAEAKRLGGRLLHIRGGQAHYDPETEILTVLDDVAVQTDDFKLETPAMRYLARFETVKSAAAVTIQGHGFDVSGTSFMYNLANGTLRIGERVSFRYAPPLTE